MALAAARCPHPEQLPMVAAVLWQGHRGHAGRAGGGERADGDGPGGAGAEHNGPAAGGHAIYLDMAAGRRVVPLVELAEGESVIK